MKRFLLLLPLVLALGCKTQAAVPDLPTLTNVVNALMIASTNGLPSNAVYSLIQSLSILTEGGRGSNNLLTASTNYGSTGETNWTATTPLGWVNTNVNGSYIRIRMGDLVAAGSLSGRYVYVLCSNATSPGIILKAFAAQSTNVLEIQTAAGTIKAGFNSAGLPFGNGANLTNLDGTMLQLGTVNSNKLDLGTSNWLTGLASIGISTAQSNAIINLASNANWVASNYLATAGGSGITTAQSNAIVNWSSNFTYIASNALQGQISAGGLPSTNGTGSGATLYGVNVFPGTLQASNIIGTNMTVTQLIIDTLNVLSNAFMTNVTLTASPEIEVTNLALRGTFTGVLDNTNLPSLNGSKLNTNGLVYSPTWSSPGALVFSNDVPYYSRNGGWWTNLTPEYVQAGTLSGVDSIGMTIYGNASKTNAVAITGPTSLIESNAAGTSTISGGQIRASAGVATAGALVGNSASLTNQLMFMPREIAAAATVQYDFSLSPWKQQTNLIGANQTCQITNVVAGQSIMTVFYGAAATDYTVVFTWPSGGKVYWLSATNGATDFTVPSNRLVMVSMFADRSTNIVAAWATNRINL